MDFNWIINIVKKYYHKFKLNPLLYSKISFIVIIALLLIYIIERYIIYNIIYCILYIALNYPLFFLKNKNFFSIKLESIIITLYLNILIARYVILSIIFLQGGLFKKIMTYEQFKFFILSIINYLENVYEYINKDKNEFIEYFMDKLYQFRNAYYNIKSKNISFIVNNYTFEEELNEMFNKYDDYIVNKNPEIKKELLKSINNFSIKINEYSNFSLFYELFYFKYTESLMMLEEYMINSFDTHIVDKINIGKEFDIYIFVPKEKKNDNKILAIYCNQNALCCESYALGHDNINAYLYDLNCTIIIWNYYGFGLRKGITTFSKIDKDIDVLSKYIKQNFNDYKIIVHGCSIGGYSSIKLTKKLDNNENVVLISDRTFGDIDKIVVSLSYGKILSVIYNILFPKFLYHSSNINNYISVPKNKKLLLFDARDEIIAYNPSSLVFNLTTKYYKEIIKPKLIKYKEYKTLIENPISLYDELKKLAGECMDKNFDENGRIFIQHLFNSIDSFEEFFMFFIIFAYPFNRYKEISYNTDIFNKTYLNVPKIFNIFVNNQKNNMSNKLLELIKIFNYLFVKINLKSDINDNDVIAFNYDVNNDKLFQFNDSFANELHKYFGYVHRIHCGHNGKLKESDIKEIMGFLQNNQFI